MCVYLYFYIIEVNMNFVKFILNFYAKIYVYKKMFVFIKTVQICNKKKKKNVFTI